MGRNDVSMLDEMAKEIGIDVAAAKAELKKLDETFGGQHGWIPEGALAQWANAYFDPARTRKFLISLGRRWEQEIDASLPSERQAERRLTAEEWVAQRDSEAKAAV